MLIAHLLYEITCEPGVTLTNDLFKPSGFVSRSADAIVTRRRLSVPCACVGTCFDRFDRFDHKHHPASRVPVRIPTVKIAIVVIMDNVQALPAPRLLVPCTTRGIPRS
jgi:hypothetical protein